MKKLIAITLFSSLVLSQAATTNSAPELASRTWVSNYVAGLISSSSNSFSITNLTLTNLSYAMNSFGTNNFSAYAQYTFNLYSIDITSSGFTRSSLWVDQDANGTYEETNSLWLYQSIGGQAQNRGQLSAWIKPSGRFVLTNEGWPNYNHTNLSTRVLVLGN